MRHLHLLCLGLLFGQIAVALPFKTDNRVFLKVIYGDATSRFELLAGKENVLKIYPTTGKMVSKKNTKSDFDYVLTSLKDIKSLTTIPRGCYRRRIEEPIP